MSEFTVVFIFIHCLLGLRRETGKRGGNGCCSRSERRDERESERRSANGCGVPRLQRHVSSDPLALPVFVLQITLGTRIIFVLSWISFRNSCCACVCESVCVCVPCEWVFKCASKRMTTRLCCRLHESLLHVIVSLFA